MLHIQTFMREEEIRKRLALSILGDRIQPGVERAAIVLQDLNRQMISAEEQVRKLNIAYRRAQIPADGDN